MYGLIFREEFSSVMVYGRFHELQFLGFGSFFPTGRVPKHAMLTWEHSAFSNRGFSRTMTVQSGNLVFVYQILGPCCLVNRMQELKCG